MEFSKARPWVCFRCPCPRSPWRAISATPGTFSRTPVIHDCVFRLSVRPCVQELGCLKSPCNSAHPPIPPALAPPRRVISVTGTSAHDQPHPTVGRTGNPGLILDSVPILTPQKCFLSAFLPCTLPPLSRASARSPSDNSKCKADSVIFLRNISSLIRLLPKYPAGLGGSSPPRPELTAFFRFLQAPHAPELCPAPPPSLSLNITSSGDPLTLGTRSRS